MAFTILQFSKNHYCMAIYHLSIRCCYYLYMEHSKGLTMSKNNKNRKKRILKKSVKSFPCENCITLARCKASKEIYESEYDFIDNLISQCSLIRDYVNQPNYHNRSYRERKMYIPHDKIKHRQDLLRMFFRTDHTEYPWKDI